MWAEGIRCLLLEPDRYESAARRLAQVLQPHASWDSAGHSFVTFCRSLLPPIGSAVQSTTSSDIVTLAIDVPLGYLSKLPMDHAEDYVLREIAEAAYVPRDAGIHTGTRHHEKRRRKRFELAVIHCHIVWCGTGVRGRGYTDCISDVTNSEFRPLEVDQAQLRSGLLGYGRLCHRAPCKTPLY